MGQEDGEGQPGVGWSRPLKSPQAFPIRKHILLVSGSVAGLLFVAVGYALLLTKNSLKNNHFLSAERQGNGSSHTRAHTSPCGRHSAFQDLPLVAEVPRQDRQHRGGQTHIASTTLLLHWTGSHSPF